MIPGKAPAKKSLTDLRTESFLLTKIYEKNRNYYASCREFIDFLDKFM